MSESTTITEIAAELANAPVEPIVVNNGVTPVKKKPTAAESLAKQRAADKAAKEAKQKIAPKKPIKVKADRSNIVNDHFSEPKSKKEKKPIKPKTPKTEKKVGAAKKSDDELRKPQLRIIKALLDAGCTSEKKTVTLDQLVKKIKINQGLVRIAIGPVATESRDAHNTKFGYRCLLSRGMIKVAISHESGVSYYLSALAEKKSDKLPLNDLGKKNTGHNQYTK